MIVTGAGIYLDEEEIRAILKVSALRMEKLYRLIDEDELNDDEKRIFREIGEFIEKSKI